MSGPPYHGWTHRPKDKGGTDPIPGLEVAAAGATSVIDLRNPSVGAFFVAEALTNFTIGRWQMNDAVTSRITGVVRVPDSFNELAVVLMLASSTTGTGDVRMQVNTRSIGVGGAIDGTITAETAQTIAVTALMSQARFPTSGGLASSPAAGEMLVVQINRIGGDGADSLTVDLVVYGAWLEVT